MDNKIASDVDCSPDLLSFQEIQLSALVFVQVVKQDSGQIYVRGHGPNNFCL